jgi:trehalose 6-phosphate synthase complex regulatory subunit
MTPGSENSNPFAKMPSLTTTIVVGATKAMEESSTSPPLSRKHPTRNDYQLTPSRVQRKSSRSTSRRSDASSRSGARSVLERTWYTDANPNCNGGLKNAVESVSDKLTKKLWIGTLGTKTNALGAELRRSIDKRMLGLDSIPIWIPDDEFECCYDEFCHQVRGWRLPRLLLLGDAYGEIIPKGPLALSALCHPGCSEEKSILRLGFI